MKDTIYRQAVIDKINEIYCYLSLSYKPKEYETARALFLDIRSAIKTMPSAEPVIRCKDCKYFEQYTDDGTFESVLKMHQWDGECSEWVGHTYMGWFCSRAERRTDE